MVSLFTDKSVTELFYENGINADPKVNKDLFSGIQTVKSYLKGKNGPRLYVFRNCVNLIREFKGYFWGDNDVPQKKDDHALDELRYFLMAHPVGNPPKREKTVIEKDKEKRYKRVINERKIGR